MPVRKIVKIDEEKCDGCGECVPSCAEGAIQIIDGKAKLISESYCDGLGACLGQCPQDAIHVIEREAHEFDEKAVAQHLANMAKHGVPEPPPRTDQARPIQGGCPGSHAQMLQPGMASRGLSNIGTGNISQLRNWPVQLHLAPVQAPYFENADLLIAADCAPFAFADFHGKFISRKTLLIGCPKLDETSVYLEKLGQIFSLNGIKSVEIAFMEVPCCFGLVSLVKEAVAASRKNIPIRLVKLGLKGTIEGTFEIPAAEAQPA
jgi:Pyruvate/2-oxoacid:ferredoxin oxidoreductase delta subunit